MKFGPVPLTEAAGATLAHSLRVKAGVIKKGRVLDDADVAALIDAGYEAVVAARLEADELDENTAALRLAEAVAGDTLTPSRAATGRVNLFATVPGLLLPDAERITRINALDEALTIATLAAYAPVAAGQNAATVKVITFGVKQSVVEDAAAIAREGAPILRLAPFQPRRVALLQSALPGDKASLLDKARAATEARLAALGCVLEAEDRCAHDTAELANHMRSHAETGCEILLVMGASAVSDRRDVVPGAIEAAGGTIQRFGVPVDPGNLILLGCIGEMVVLGLPGSARSPRLHGLDWVLQRLVAGLELRGSDIAALGVGGLLKDIPGRPLPREKAAPPPAEPSARNKVAAIVLAAGRSRRMGDINKLLAEIDGVPMVARAVNAALASAADPVLVVTGHEAARVETALAGRAVRFAHNPDYRDGLSASLKAGLAALPPDVDGALVCLGDMPRVTAADLDRLIAAFAPAAGRAICVPVHDGKRGNPVLWGRRFFAEMLAIAGDVGARHLIGEYADQVHEVEMSESGVLIDVDSPAALAAL